MKTLKIIGLAFLIAATTSLMSQNRESDAEEVMAMLTEMLDLSESQQGQVGALLAKYKTNMDYILLKYEGEEEPDVGAMIGEIRDERDGYRKELQGILSPNQYDTYMAKVNDVLTQMFNDLAEIRLIDIQPKMDLTDSQLESLVPIVGKSLMSTVQLLFENAGTRLGVAKKVSIANKLKKIEKEKRDGMSKILTPDQLAAYDKYKEEQKAARKNK